MASAESRRLESVAAALGIVAARSALYINIVSFIQHTTGIQYCRVPLCSFRAGSSLYELCTLVYKSVYTRTCRVCLKCPLYNLSMQIYKKRVLFLQVGSKCSVSVHKKKLSARALYATPHNYCLVCTSASSPCYFTLGFSLRKSKLASNLLHSYSALSL